MTQIDRSALVFHSAKEMFDVVNNVQFYPDFLPWCAKAEVLTVSQEEMVASLSLAKAGLKYDFTTRNTLKHAEQIGFELVEGPFNHLFGKWDFSPLDDDACKVNLVIDFEVSGKVAAFALSKVFTQVANTMVEAFVARANTLYGEKSL